MMLLFKLIISTMTFIGFCKSADRKTFEKNLISRGKAKNRFISQFKSRREDPNWSIGKEAFYEASLALNNNMSSKSRISTYGIATTSEAVKKGLTFEHATCPTYLRYIVRTDKDCYLPYRQMKLFSDSPSGFKRTTAKILSGSDVIDIWISTTLEIKYNDLLNKWQGNLQERQNKISETIKSLSSDAITYSDSYTNKEKSKNNSTNTQTTIDDLTTKITNQKKLSEETEKTRKDAETSYNSELATLKDLQTKADGIKANITSNDAQEVEKTKIINDYNKDLDGAKTSITNSKTSIDDYLPLLQSSLDFLTKEIPEEAENLAKAKTLLDSGDLKGFLDLINVIHPL
jgi:hypothetical protein